MKKINFTLLLLVLIFTGILYIIWAGLNPVNQFKAYRQRQLIESVAEMANVKATEATALVEIGKTPNFDLETIKKANPIDAEVYKDAKEGDIVISFASKLVIYRPSDDKLVYEGETPGQLLTKQNESRLQKLMEAAKSAGLIAKDFTTMPQANVISNIEQLKSNPFYKDAQNGDLLANFGSIGLIVIYNEQNDKIVNAAVANFQSVNNATEAKTEEPKETK